MAHAELVRRCRQTSWDEVTYLLFRRRTSFLLVAPFILLVLARPSWAAFAIGVPFVIAGQAIRIWSAGYLSKMSNLITGGPFAICRNPLYIGSFLGCTGYLIMCNRPVVFIVGVALFWLFHGGAIVFEEKLLRELFGDEFRRYCECVPRFVPRFRREAGQGVFSLALALRNNEHRSAAGALVLIGLFALRAAYPSFSLVAWVRALV